MSLYNKHPAVVSLDRYRYQPYQPVYQPVYQPQLYQPQQPFQHPFDDTVLFEFDEPVAPVAKKPKQVAIKPAPAPKQSKKSGPTIGDLCPECGRESERYRGISNSMFCGYHYGGGSTTASKGAKKSTPKNTPAKKSISKADQCPECGRENERSRGISNSKYCGYHFGGTKRTQVDPNACPMCGCESERSRGISNSKYCGFHH